MGDLLVGGGGRVSSARGELLLRTACHCMLAMLFTLLSADAHTFTPGEARHLQNACCLFLLPLILFLFTLTLFLPHPMTGAHSAIQDGF